MLVPHQHVAVLHRAGHDFRHVLGAGAGHQDGKDVWVHRPGRHRGPRAGGAHHAAHGGAGPDERLQAPAGVRRAAAALRAPLHPRDAARRAAPALLDLGRQPLQLRQAVPEVPHAARAGGRPVLQLLRRGEEHSAAAADLDERLSAEVAPQHAVQGHGAVWSHGIHERHAPGTQADQAAGSPAVHQHHEHAEHRRLRVHGLDVPQLRRGALGGPAHPRPRRQQHQRRRPEGRGDRARHRQRHRPRRVRRHVLQHADPEHDPGAPPLRLGLQDRGPQEHGGARHPLAPVAHHGVRRRRAARGPAPQPDG
mmetsp:Transcript_37204/g.104997  ORF Transcript_37204/g.104997 Transcript_37204/m.104997 type:complete len:308 (+) Transcript_37204:425-1348(+)